MKVDERGAGDVLKPEKMAGRTMDLAGNEPVRVNWQVPLPPGGYFWSRNLVRFRECGMSRWRVSGFGPLEDSKSLQLMSPPPGDRLVQNILSFIDAVFELSVAFVAETSIDGGPLSGGLQHRVMIKA